MISFFCCFFFFKQKTAYEMLLCDWSSDVCSSDLVALAVDLTGRATNPSDKMKRISPPRKLGRGIETLTKQIKVGETSSKQYYETILLNRLRDVMVEKVSLETGMEIDRTKEILMNKLQGPSLLHDH